MTTIGANTRTRTFAAALGAAVLFAHPAPVPAGDGHGAITHAQTAFACDLYGEVSGGKGNLFLSPSSVYAALSMAYAGAAGETAEEMKEVLHAAPLGARLHDAFRDLRYSIAEAGEIEGVTIRTANALWSQAGFFVRDEFAESCRGFYDAETGHLDFAADPEAARFAINGWAEEKTAGGVPELLEPGALTSLTRIVLGDAVHFLGRWHHPFDAANTRGFPFTTDAGLTVTMKGMAGEAEYPYFEDDRVQVLEMPYVGERLSLVAVLPKETGGLHSIEKSLTPETLGEWISGLRKREVGVLFPKFAFDSAFDLRAALATLGMPRAFSDDADFSGITGDRELFIDKVVHGAAIEVDEQGTEASAATAVVFKKRGMGTLFRADHSFLFLIRDRATGAILFMGRVVDPGMW